MRTNQARWDSRRRALLRLCSSLLISVAAFGCSSNDDGDKAYLPVGTLVTTEDGSLAIEELRPDMVVKAFDSAKGSVTFAKVTKIYHGDATRLRSLELVDGPTVRLMRHRRIFRVNSDTRRLNLAEWVKSDDVGTGDTVLGLSDEQEALPQPVLRVYDIALAYPVTTYGVELSGGQGLFANGILVQ